MAPATAPGLLSIIEAAPAPIHVQTEAIDGIAGWRVRTIVCRSGRVLQRIDRESEPAGAAAQHRDVTTKLLRLAARRAVLATPGPVPVVLLEWTMQRFGELAWGVLGTATTRALLKAVQERQRDEHFALGLFRVTEDAHVEPAATCPDFLPHEAVDGVAAWAAHVVSALGRIDPEIANTSVAALTAPMREPLQRFGFYASYALAREANMGGPHNDGSAVIGRVVPVRVAVAV